MQTATNSQRIISRMHPRKKIFLDILLVKTCPWKPNQTKNQVSCSEISDVFKKDYFFSTFMRFVSKKYDYFNSSCLLAEVETSRKTGNIDEQLRLFILQAFCFCATGHLWFSFWVFVSFNVKKVAHFLVRETNTLDDKNYINESSSRINIHNFTLSTRIVLKTEVIKGSYSNWKQKRLNGILISLVFILKQFLLI